MELKTALGEVVRKLRTDRKWNQANLMELAKVDQGAVSKIEHGKRGVSFDSLERVAAAFDMASSQLLALAEARARGAEILTPEKLAAPVSEGRSLGLVVNQFENDIEALRYAVGALLGAAALHRPREGSEIAAGIRAAAPESFHDQGMTKQFLDILVPAKQSSDAAPSVPRRAARGR